MSRRARFASCLAAMSLVAVAAPGAAVAGTMYDFGSYEGDVGTNTVTASFDGASMIFTDTAGMSVATGPCTPLSGTSLSCPYDPGYRFSLVSGNDSFTYTGGAPLPALGAGYDLFNISGGPGADVLTGSPLADVLEGDGRDENYDQIPDPGGNDQLIGLGGDDELRDNDGASNRIEGGAGSDRTYLGLGKAANTILGGPGNDILLGGGGPETIDGEDGADNINGGDGDDQVRGGSGNDDVEGGGDADVTDGGTGDDLVSASFHGGGCATDTLIGGTGRDSLYAACGVPTMKMRDGAKDTARCLPKVTRATVERDAVDEVTGGACERKSKGCKKKAKKGASAAKKTKKCRKKGRKRG